MLLRYQMAGGSMPGFDSGKIETYCKPIDKALEKGGKASAPPFINAVEVIEKVGEVSRDRRKGQRYTEEILREVKSKFKKKLGG